MDRKQIIGLILIFGLIFVFTWINSPDKIETETETVSDTLKVNKALEEASVQPEEAELHDNSKMPDSLGDIRNQLMFGEFYKNAEGEEQEYIVENELVRLKFTNKGGRIKEVLLKEYKKLVVNDQKKEVKKALKLLDHPKSSFEFLLPVESAKDGIVTTDDLYFTAKKNGERSITFEITGQDGIVFRQIYTLKPGEYTVDYRVETTQFKALLKRGTNHIELNWVDYLDKIEKNADFEKTTSTVNYKIYQGDKERCSVSKDDVDDVKDKKLEWVSNSNQFFSSALMVKGQPYFDGGVMSVKQGEKEDDFLKICENKLYLPFGDNSEVGMDMAFYFGPNDFERLKAFDNNLEETISFGSSIIGTLNRWIIRPLFVFFLDWTKSAGLSILLLILLVKMALYPLTYKMLKSSAKMNVLKPEINQIKEKYKNDAQTTQVKTMELYRKFGVSPFGGCMPMILQMPIWFALFRFFPAAIEFRQKSFLWAPDLSSYDVLFYLPFSIPMFGAHVSLFALLWTISTLLYTYYNAQNMDMGTANNPALKYMQYIMPVFFIVFFNSYASGLTAYMFFSNIINVLQTVATKRFVFDDAKIRAELELKKDKPKKKNSFSQRLEDAMKQQQKLAEDKARQKKK
ncbi:MAG TPA: membrane protein insertase YidC [Saprospiraceae bacterium]|mgnify:CR=1 FL=1|nr:membrane protein insertase YidC [Saprospiraceae bacterium]